MDAANAFNAMNRKAALWHARHLWPQAARYLYNTYKGWAPLIVAGDKKPLYSREGTTQGDPLSMAFYACGVLPLIRLLKDPAKGVQMWYADDSTKGGKLREVKAWFELLKAQGPGYGYFPEPKKSVLVVAERDLQEAREVFGANGPKITTNQRLLGGHLGSADGKRAYVQGKAESWADAVKKLAKLAEKLPQAVFVALTKSLQCEWQYVQRVTKDCGADFKPVEEAIASSLLPSLLQEKVSPVDRLLYGLPVKFGGLGVADPTTTADAAFRTSRAAAEHLVQAIKGEESFQLAKHRNTQREARAAYRREKLEESKRRSEEVVDSLPEERKRAVNRAMANNTGQWLNTMGTAANGNVLSKHEWRDGFAVRYGKQPRDLPKQCDAPGCSAKYSLDHALNCPKGGLIIRRHDEIANEVAALSRLCFSYVQREPVTKVGPRPNQAGGARGQGGQEGGCAGEGSDGFPDGLRTRHQGNLP